MAQGRGRQDAARHAGQQRRGRVAGLPQPTRHGRSAVHRHALRQARKQQIVAELGDLIFPDPESKTWQTADAYLSGNVRAKLAAAERAGPQYARNVNALRAVQPEDVLPGDIDANLGAPWIPESDIQAFAAESIPRRAVFGPGRPPEERCRLEPGGRLRRQGIGRRHVRIRHRAGQRHLASWNWPST